MANILAIDFDGVIADTEPGEGWGGHGPLLAPPVHGAEDGLTALADDWAIVIFSARATTIEGRRQIKNWLTRNGLGDLIVEVTAMKPLATAYIDDKGHRFAGWRDLRRVYEVRD